MVILIFTFLLRAQNYLPCATCSAVAWCGWNGSPGEEGNGALVLPATSFFTPGRASPTSRLQGNCTAWKSKGTLLLQCSQLHIIRFNATLLLGGKRKHRFQIEGKHFHLFVMLCQSTFFFSLKYSGTLKTNTLICPKYPRDGFLWLRYSLSLTQSHWILQTNQPTKASTYESISHVFLQESPPNEEGKYYQRATYFLVSR